MDPPGFEPGASCYFYWSNWQREMASRGHPVLPTATTVAKQAFRQAELKAPLHWIEFSGNLISTGC